MYFISLQYDGRSATLEEAQFLYGPTVEQIDEGCFNVELTDDEISDVRDYGAIERAVGRYFISVDTP
jgi:hypothetical protein